MLFSKLFILLDEKEVLSILDVMQTITDGEYQVITYNQSQCITYILKMWLKLMLHDI